MSNMNKSIAVPQGADVKIADQTITLKGPKGELTRELPERVTVTWDEQERALSLQRKGNEREARQLHGLFRSLVQNMVIGVTEGFRKEMEVHGTGFQANLQGDTLTITVGFCHPVKLTVPKGLTVEVTTPQAQPDNPARFNVSGPDKQMVGQFVADVRSVRPPEPYKGKGVRITGEYVRRKEGKAFAGAG